jgi:S1-C subfamily serine protease
MTLTTGIVSSVRDGATISDVNINRGNSGGPMLNLAGEVVGVKALLISRPSSFRCKSTYAEHSDA